MSLDEELRSALEHQARTRPAPPPDPDGLIRGGRARRRRRTVRRAGAAAGAAVVLAAGGFAASGLVAPRDPETASPPSVEPTASTSVDRQGRAELAPGTHRTFVGIDATGRLLEADITYAGDNWSGGDFPLATDRSGAAFAGVGVYQPTALAAGRGCVDDATLTDVGRTPRRVADQLTNLPRSTVMDDPTPTRAFDRTAIHLRLRIDVECTAYYRLAETPSGHRGITYTAPGFPADVLIDLWVLEAGGSVVVVDQWHTVGASAALVEQVAQTRRSVVLVTDG